MRIGANNINNYYSPPPGGRLFREVLEKFYNMTGKGARSTPRQVRHVNGAVNIAGNNRSLKGLFKKIGIEDLDINNLQTAFRGRDMRVSEFIPHRRVLGDVVKDENTAYSLAQQSTTAIRNLKAQGFKHVENTSKKYGTSIEGFKPLKGFQKTVKVDGNDVHIGLVVDPKNPKGMQMNIQHSGYGDFEAVGNYKYMQTIRFNEQGEVTEQFFTHSNNLRSYVVP